MAESITSFIVAQISEKLNTDPWKSLPGLGSLLEGFRAELQQLGGFLRDADARKTEDDNIGQCVADIRQIASKAEDLLDRYAFQVSTTGDNALSRCVYVWSKSLVPRKVGLEIGSLKTKLSKLRQGLMESNVKRDPVEHEGTSSRRWRPTSFSFSEEDDFVGIEADVDLLVRRLVTEDDKPDYCGVVCILGMGGSGKTTLATKVYNHQIVRRHFTRFAWVRLSEQFRLDVLLKKMMLQLYPEKSVAITLKEGEEYRLAGQLFRHLPLGQRRCLIVLDDVLHTYVLNAFPITHNGIKFLVTTRSRRVADTIVRGNSFEPRRSTLEKSWELLRTKTLRERSSEESKKMESLGKELLGLCGDLPLHEVILGGILVTKTALREWETVYGEITSSSVIPLEASSFTLFLTSYNCLSYQLKLCFLYLGSFPEDTNIKAETLYRLLIAEGLVSMEDCVGEESMTDLAESYLGELAERGMVQVQKSNPAELQKFESCCLHDPMRDFCLLKGKEEGFSYSSEREPDRPRRLVINLDAEEDIYFTSRIGKYIAKQIRVLHFVVPDDYPLFNYRMEKAIKIIRSRLGRFKMLRVLSIEALCPVGMWKLPKCIGKLIYLRYLSLRDSSIVTLPLPSSFGNLKNLQTLDLRVFRIGRLPNILWRMTGLKHLYLPSLYKMDRQVYKVRLDSLSRLETLENFNDRIYDTSDLSKLENLRVLSVEDCLELENLKTIVNHARSSSANNRLQRVSISTALDFSSNREQGLGILGDALFARNIQSFCSNGAVHGFPQFEDHMSSSLVRLSMNLSGLEGDDVMRTLEKLPKLRALFLWSFEGKEMTFHSTGFPQLRILRLFLFLNLKRWTVEKGAMPNLSSLSISGFTAMEMIPDGIRFVPYLKELDIRIMPEKFNKKILTPDGKEGEDYGEVGHVTSLLVYS